MMTSLIVWVAPQCNSMSYPIRMYSPQQTSNSVFFRPYAAVGWILIICITCDHVRGVDKASRKPTKVLSLNRGQTSVRARTRAARRVRPPLKVSGILRFDVCTATFSTERGGTYLTQHRAPIGEENLRKRCRRYLCSHPRTLACLFALALPLPYLDALLGRSTLGATLSTWDSSGLKVPRLIGLPRLLECSAWWRYLKLALCMPCRTRAGTAWPIPADKRRRRLLWQSLREQNADAQTRWSLESPDRERSLQGRPDRTSSARRSRYARERCKCPATASTVSGSI